MRKRTAVWLVIALSLILIGCMIFIGAMAMLNWDFTKLSTSEYETNEYQIRDDYKSISIVTDTADIVFVPSQNAASSVVCYEENNAKHSVAVKDGTLVIQVENTKKWYEHIGINFTHPKITVSIPQGQYNALSVKSHTGDVKIAKEYKFDSIEITESTGSVTNYASASDVIKIKTNTGSIRVENATAGTLDLCVDTGRVTVSNVVCAGDVKIQVSTGRTNLNDVSCQNLTSRGSTGSISLANVIAAEKFSIKRSTGDIKFDASDAGDISVTTDTGDITGTLLTDKIFIAQTDTGKIDVPNTSTGGKCEISTDTGDIKLRIS